MMIKLCSKCHCCTIRGFYFIKTVYKLFDNPSYSKRARDHILCPKEITNMSKAR